MVVPHTDVYLILAWVFTIVCGLAWFVRSEVFARWMEGVRNAWRAAEHEHQD